MRPWVPDAGWSGPTGAPERTCPSVTRCRHTAPRLEGWFWRVTVPASGRVVVALCGVNRHPGGDWATVAVALHPGDIVRSAALDDAHADTAHFALGAGTSGRPPRGLGRPAPCRPRRRPPRPALLRVLRLAQGVRRWRDLLGVPFLNQYWQPYRLGGGATGGVTFGGTGAGRPWSLDDAVVYGERNWGAGFPDRWWWGQAHDFDGADVSVAFSGGVLSLGPIARQVCGVVVRLGEQVIRITPPAPVHSEVTPGRWAVRARSWRYQVDLDGDGTGIEPHVLPVPVSAERRNVDTDFEHLAGRLRCVVRERGRVAVRGHVRAGRPRGGEPARP